MTLGNQVCSVSIRMNPRRERGEAVDAWSMGTVLLAIVVGAGSAFGEQLWASLMRLVHRPLHPRSAADRPAGEAHKRQTELAVLEKAPADMDRALVLAGALLARAGTDAQFRAELEAWWDQSAPLRTGQGNVTNGGHRWRSAWSCNPGPRHYRSHDRHGGPLCARPGTTRLMAMSPLTGRQRQRGICRAVRPGTCGQPWAAARPSSPGHGLTARPLLAQRPRVGEAGQARQHARSLAGQPAQAAASGGSRR